MNRNQPVEIVIETTPEVEGALRALGRTEDVKFSPDYRRLAIAGFSANKILVLDVCVADVGRSKAVALTGCVELVSDSLQAPHGVAFLGNETIIATNRLGEVPIFRLPHAGKSGATHDLRPSAVVRGGLFSKLKSPGSVAVLNDCSDRYDILVCNNYVNRVTRHRIAMDGRIRVQSNEVLLSRRMDIPDGVAVSEDHKWIAISNHNTHQVLLFENTRDLSRRTEPVGVLRGLEYPHGVRFAADGCHILVADAGAPFVRVYSRASGGWEGARDPDASWRVLDEATFLKGRYNPQEGGPKGIDIHRDGEFMVTTCEHKTLAFFGIAGLVSLV